MVNVTRTNKIILSSEDIAIAIKAYRGAQIPRGSWLRLRSPGPKSFRSTSFRWSGNATD